jgi:hypothetical protein
VPGQAYDLAITGPRLRTLRIEAVIAPSAGLFVSVERAPRLRGAIGVPPGARCPIDSVMVRADRQQSYATLFAGACLFEFDDVSAAAELDVVATGPGWYLSGTVSVPARGDPEPLCLNPPCAPFLPEMRASLAGTVSGGNASEPVTFAVNGDRAYCDGEGGCILDDLPAGVPLGVWAESGDCAHEAREVTLRPGLNRIDFPCRRKRSIEGVVRRIDGTVPESLEVRCRTREGEEQEGSDSGESAVFSLECPVETTAIEFRAGADDPWQSAPLPSTPGPAVIDLVLR